MRKLFIFLFLAAGLLFADQSASAQLIYGLNAYTDVPAFSLVTVSSASPNNILTSQLITGVPSGWYLTSIEVRPATQQLYTLATAASNTLNSPTVRVQLYTLNPVTAAVAAVGSAVTLNTSGYVSQIAFGFDPSTGSAKVVMPGGFSYRLDATTGALLGTDSPVAYAPNDLNANQNARLQAIAFTNSYGGSAGGQLFGLDKNNNRLVRISGGNQLQTVGAGTAGIALNGQNTRTDLAIAANPAAGTNTLYLLRSEEAYNGTFFYSDSELYTLNATTGVAALVGPAFARIQNGNAQVNVIDIAIPNGIVSATRDRLDELGGLQISSNPVRGTARLTFNLPCNAAVQVLVTDNLGRYVVTPTAVLLAAGANSLSWESASLRPGLYHMQLVVNGERVAARRIVVE